MARHRDRQLAARVATPMSTSARASGPDRPAPTQAGSRCSGPRPRERERTSADDDEDDRRAGRDDRLEELLLATEQPEIEPVPELPGRRVVGQARALPQTTIATSAPAPLRPPRRARRRSRRGDRSRGRGRHLAPRRRAGPRDRPVASELVERFGCVSPSCASSAGPSPAPSPGPSMPRLDPAPRLAASACGRGGCSRRAGRGAVGDRPDDREAAAGPIAAAARRRSRGARASVVRAPARRPSSASRPTKGRRRGASTYGSLEQPEPQLHPQDVRRPPRRAAPVDAPVRERREERLAELVDPRQLASTPAASARPAASPGPASADGPCGPSRAHVVGRDDARRNPTRRADDRVSSSADAWHGTPSTSQ